MYQEDSFFSLGVGGQIGLACLSLTLFLITLLGAARLMRGRSTLLRIAIAVGAYALFVWLSPQVYYTYYRMIFDGLPNQWVIDWPPFVDMIQHASFTGRANLSAHGKGILFWVLIAIALKQLMRRARRR